MSNLILQDAVINGNVNEIKDLLEKGADINEMDQHGRTPLFKAISTSNMQMVEFLINNGAEVDTRDSLSGSTPLHLVSLFADQSNIVKFLLEKGANANTTCDAGIPVLTNAALNGCLEVVKLLLKYGADPNVKDKNGKLAYIIAKQEGHRDVAKLLKNHMSSDEAKSSRCFIATAACGSQKSLEVSHLQEFRDLILINTWFGRELILCYEYISPPIANLISQSKFARKLTLFFLIIPFSRIAKSLLINKKKRSN